MKKLLLLFVIVLMTSCSLALYYQNHTRDSQMHVVSEQSADSSTISVTIPKIKTSN